MSSQTRGSDTSIIAQTAELPQISQMILDPTTPALFPLSHIFFDESLAFGK